MVYDLAASLRAFNPPTEHERIDRDTMLDFLGSGQDCFVRTNRWAHFTGSALLLNRAMDRVLLNHHRFLNIWLQFGGHADGDADLRAVARREVEEESGFTAVEWALDDIFDVSIHGVPYNPAKAEPAHLHYDVRYLCRLSGDDESFTLSDESHDLRWCGYAEAMALCGPGSTARMLDKWQKLVGARA